MRIVLGCLLLVFLACPLLSALELATSDGLALRFAEGGDLQAVVVDGKALPSGDLRGGFFVAEIASEGEELVRNGSLELDEDGDGVPDGFSSGGVWQRDNTVAHTGQWSMKAHVPGPEDGMSGSFGIVVPVEGGATYLVSFWLKSQGRGGSHPSSIGYIQQQNAAGERTTQAFQQLMSGGVTGDSDWTRISTMLTTEGDTRRLYVRTDIYRAYGTLWADDFSVRKLATSAQHLPTQATADDGKISLNGRDAGRALTVAATWRTEGAALRLEGTIRSEAERDRCLRLSYRLPLSALGGIWGNDVGTPKTIEPGARYQRAEPFGQFGPYSVYPFSSLVPPDASAGISLGVPMDPPRPFRLIYAADEGLMVEWDLGLSSLPERYPHSADFFAVLYRHDPQWGFRAAAERYYRLFPNWFEVRVPRFGNWYYLDLRQLPQPEDFGLAYNEMVRPGTVEADHALGYLNFAYTEPWGWWGWALGLKPAEDDPQPSYEQMLAILKERAADAEALARPGMNPTKVAHTILNSGVYDREGRLRLRGGYVARWGGYNWCLNPSPYAVEEGKLSRFQATYEWEIEPKLAMGADGIYLDSIVSSWTAVPNYRPDHLRRTRHPLTFSALEPVPAQLGVWNQYEFAEHLSRDLHGRGKLLMANIFPYNWVFFNHLLDVLGHETWGADGLEKMRAERTLAYHKPYTWLMQQGEGGAPEDREKWMQVALLYGIAPNIVGGTTDPALYEKWRPLYRKYMPTIIALCAAGWEPVTYATADPATVLVERFGPSDGQLFLTAHNPADQPAKVTFALDLGALGIGQLTGVQRLPDDTQIPVHGTGFSDVLEPGVTCAYRLRY